MRRSNPKTDLSEVLVPVLFSPAAEQPEQPVCSFWLHLVLVLLLQQSLHQRLVSVQLRDPSSFRGREVVTVRVCLPLLRQALDALLAHQMTCRSWIERGHDGDLICVCGQSHVWVSVMYPSSHCNSDSINSLNVTAYLGWMVGKLSNAVGSIYVSGETDFSSKESMFAWLNSIFSFYCHWRVHQDKTI